MSAEGAVAVSYFGDGATEEGVFHESLNLAATFNLPVLFVCENNLYSSHLDIALRQPSDRVARFAEAHRIPSATVDGNDVVAVASTAADLINRGRRGEGPGFLEGVTYRHRGHVGDKDDVDVGVRRSLAEISAWKARDPILRLSQAMIAERLLTAEDLADLEASLRRQVSECCARAEAASYPPASALIDFVFGRGR
jgi:pyruvate dehydrogenase E1 component alpha subunit